MLDIVLETVRVVVLAGILTFAWKFGSRNEYVKNLGWRLVASGLCLLIFGSMLDITDNFPALNRYVLVGDTPVQAFLEKFVGSLGGFLLIAAGLRVWLPEALKELSQSEAQRAQILQLEEQHDSLTAAVHERTQQLEALNKQVSVSDAQLKAFVQNIPAEIVIKDTDRKYLLVNSTFESNNGVLQEDVIGKQARDVFPDWVAKLIDNRDEAVLNARVAEVHELPGMIGDRDTVYSRLTFPIFGEDEALIGLGTMSSDVTEKQRAEVKLRASEERYRELYEESPVPFMEEDWAPLLRMMRELGLNSVQECKDFFDERPEFVQKLYDATTSYGVSNSVLSLYEADSQAQFLEALRYENADAEETQGFGRAVIALFFGENSYQYDVSETTCTGKPITTRIKFSLPSKYEDTWSRVLVSIEDITERHQAELSMRRAQRMEAIGQLTGGVAHDFNNLLAVIQGSAEILEVDPSHDREMVESILKAAQRGADLTHRLLAYARRQPLTPRSLNIAELVEGMKPILLRTLGETINVQSKVPQDLWNAVADQSQLEDALLNLALNSRDAMPKGGNVRIECANVVLSNSEAGKFQDVRPGKYVLLSVTDTGSGMSAETKARAFEPFYSTKDVGSGSGLGLSMVFGFAKQSGGHALIESKPGHGSTVEILLPRGLAEAPQADVPSTKTAPKGGQEKILLVEDDVDVRKLTVRILEKLGYLVVAAEDAREARNMTADGFEFDLVLSDVVLPGGISGPDFAEELRKQYPASRFLFMSGYHDETADFSKLGATLLGKPFTRIELAEAVSAALQRNPLN